jgi:hypothetical protein
MNGLNLAKKHMQLPYSLVIIPGKPLSAEKAIAQTHQGTKSRHPTL